MSILTAHHLSKSFGALDVLQDVTLSLAHGQRAALVGPNGAGKTTLLHILAGMDEPSGGAVHRARGQTIGFLPQHADQELSEATTLHDLMRSVFAQLDRLAQQMRELEVALANPAQHDTAMEKYSKIAEQFEHAGGYTFELRIEQVLSGVGFDLGDRVVETILPPTYRRYLATFDEVCQGLQAHALPGARVERIQAPLKAVAARLGLVRYGRNNITYAAGIGSYLQLCGYVTDARLPATDRSPQPPMLRDECEGCETCRLACPTGAIGPGRVLLHAEHCLTFANELPGPWPEWVPATAHHCLLGCLACQRSCPANPRLEISDSGVTFTSDETRVLLGEVSSTDRGVDDGIRRKLEDLGLSGDEGVLGRNLRALLDRRCRAR